MTKDLIDAINAVEWGSNVNSFVSDELAVAALDKACQRIAIWSKQLENVESKNPAITFIRALQLSAHQAVATISLSIYKAAAGSIRGMVENALYYTYFRTHHAELASLIRDPSYYTSKSEILIYHKTHTPDFQRIQEKLGLISRIDKWYSSISAIVHGQLPGVWVEQQGLAGIKPNSATLGLVVVEFCEAERIVHELFLATIGRERWDDFSHPAKKELLAGMHGDIKSSLGLDKH